MQPGEKGYKNNMPHSIAIDGPAAAGKTTQAKLLAKKLGYLYVDTGAMYRALAYAALRDDKKPLDVIGAVDLQIQNTGEEQRMLLNGVDITDQLRTNQISLMASDVAKVPEVRQFLLGRQRELARKNNVVMEGRDIGTVVLPDAEAKIFLIAALSVRAERRMHEMGLSDGEAMHHIMEEMHRRDVQDMTRAEAPLVKAKDAVVLDNSELTIDQTTEAILNLIEQVND